MLYLGMHSKTTLISPAHLAVECWHSHFIPKGIVSMLLRWMKHWSIWISVCNRSANWHFSHLTCFRNASKSPSSSTSLLFLPAIVTSGVQIISVIHKVAIIPHIYSDSHWLSSEHVLSKYSGISNVIFALSALARALCRTYHVLNTLVCGAHICLCIHTLCTNILMHL